MEKRNEGEEVVLKKSYTDLQKKCRENIWHKLKDMQMGIKTM